MSDSQQINHMFRRIASSILLTFGIILLVGCSNSTQKATADQATAQAQFDAGQLDAARTTINRALAERDDIADIHMLRGRIEVASHNYDTAFDAFSNVLLLDPGNMEALLGVAQLGLRNGHLRESEDAADRALALDANQSQALVIKGIHNLLHHRNEEALKNADAILARSSIDQNGGILRARALAMLDRSDEALAQVLALRKLSGNSAELVTILRELYRQKNDADDPAIRPAAAI